MLNISGISTADSLLSVMVHPAALRVALQDLTPLLSLQDLTPLFRPDPAVSMAPLRNRGLSPIVLVCNDQVA